MPLRLALRHLATADAIGVRDADHDVDLVLLEVVLNLGEQLVAGVHIAQRLRTCPPGADAAVMLRAGGVTGAAPTMARRELVDLMDQRSLTPEGVAAVLHYLFPPEPSEEPSPWPTSGPGS